MNQPNYQCSIAADLTPSEAFESIAQVNAWWAKNFEGSANKLEGFFTVRFGETFVTFKVTESIPGKKLAWHVVDCYLHWIKDKTEWTGTTVVFEISAIGDKTQIIMTHLGLVPQLECYSDCEAGWNKHLRGSLYKFLTNKVGVPV